MVNYEDMRKFIKMYDEGYFKSQRYGQAFCNHFNIHDPDLFYEWSRKFANDFIYKEYITVCDPTG